MTSYLLLSKQFANQTQETRNIFKRKHFLNLIQRRQVSTAVYNTMLGNA